MTEKQYFSALRRSKEGVILRNANTRIEQLIPWKDLEIYFIKETPNLYYWNTDNPDEDKMQSLIEEMNEDMAKILPTFLLLRKSATDTMGLANLSHVLSFGQQVEDFCKKYGVSFAEFAQHFQLMFKAMFGESISYEGILQFQGLDKED